MILLFISTKIMSHFHLKIKTQSSYKTMIGISGLLKYSSCSWASSMAWLGKKVWSQTDIGSNINSAI